MLYVNILVTKKNKLSETEYSYRCFWPLIFRVGGLFYSSGPGEITNILGGAIYYGFTWLQRCSRKLWQTYRQEMKWLIELCGFEIVDIYKDYAWDKADEKPGNCIWVLKKK